MLREKLTAAVRSALSAAVADGSLPAPPGGTDALPVTVEFARAAGGYAADAAGQVARARKTPERAAEYAAALAEALNGLPEAQSLLATAAEADGTPAGQVILRPRPEAYAAALRAALDAGESFGRSETGAGKRVLVEFVSANPNGPITVAHARGGAIGDALAALFENAGWAAEREFYLNDATNSKQMRVFARSVYAHYRRLLGHDEPIPEDGYPGEFVAEIAQAFHDEEAEEELAGLTPEQAVAALQEFALDRVLEEQRAALDALGIGRLNWFSEESLRESGAVAATLDALKSAGHAYEENGALWLRSTSFGDAADRALVRADGTPTYLAGDLAYHRDKFERGYDLAVDVWGADHSGYVERTQAGLAALGYDPARLHVALFQPVRLLKDGAEVKSGRLAGGTVTLAELIEEVGRDAARLFLLLRPADAPLDLDIDLARRQDRSNPLFLVRSALERSAGVATGDVPSTVAPDEAALVAKVDALPSEAAGAAAAFAPDRVARYAVDLAALLHAHLDRPAAPNSAVVAAGRRALERAVALLGLFAAP
jgi:arginyl-tRNA synthetase